MVDFLQLEWSRQVELDCRAIVRLALEEDLAQQQDLTTQALVPSGLEGRANIVSRQEGIVAGFPALLAAIDEMGVQLEITPQVEERVEVANNQVLAKVEGEVRDLLTSERILLNLLGRMMGIATLAGKFSRAVVGTGVRIYDTRKTTPGWRRLEKYAARCGGAHNHRMGLYDAVLIKDNHLAHLQETKLQAGGNHLVYAVERARDYLSTLPRQLPSVPCLIEIEVDTLEQLAHVLSARPDIVLLDNMTPNQLCAAVRMRDQQGPQVELEASGGICLETVCQIAETGVDRISVGAITHSAVVLDVGLDWLGK